MLSKPNLTTSVVPNFVATKSPKEEMYMLLNEQTKATNDTPITTTLHQGQSKGTRDSQTNNSPASPDNLLVRELFTKIPDQMSHSVERMVGERKGKRELQWDLGSKRESAKRSSERRGLKVPSEQRRHKVCQGEGVETAGERNTGDTVERGPDPCDLRLVDA